MLIITKLENYYMIDINDVFVYRVFSLKFSFSLVKKTGLKQFVLTDLVAPR